MANLVDSHGEEAKLSREFNKLSQLDSEKCSNSWKYVEFDFHLNCRKMAYENIEKLIKILENELNSYGYFEGNDTGKVIIKKQSGIIRTNCIDCLDRTNVVQSVLGNRVLLAQLKDFEILPKEASFDSFGQNLMETFRNVWTDNADAISSQYSGTGALKTDFTRTGKRTIFGLIQDGANSVLRYFFGNFSDGKRQDSLDLLFGSYIVNPNNYKSPFRNLPIDPIRTLVTWILFYSILFFFFFSHFNTKYSTIGMLICTFIVILLIQFIRTNGKRFVQKPRLNVKM